MLFQYVCKKEAATSLPISRELAIIPTASELPEKSTISPLILKKAAQPATNKAEKATSIMNVIKI
jgi:hypothetical protein